MIFRGAMAIQAPGHALWLMLVNDLHFIHRAMAAVATDTAIHVNSMVEIGIIGNLVNSNPVDRLAGFPAFTNGFQFGACGFDLRVAGHAGLGAGDVRVRSDLHEAMAVATIHAQLLHVDHVRKWNGLGGLVADTCKFGSEIISQPAGDRGNDRAYADHELQGKPVCPFWKKICHLVKGHE